MGDNSHGIDPDRIQLYCKEISNLVKTGVEIAIVIGGGNIFRGVSAASKGIDRVQADYMGCLLYTSPSPRDATLSRMPSSA